MYRTRLSGRLAGGLAVLLVCLGALLMTGLTCEQATDPLGGLAGTPFFVTFPAQITDVALQGNQVLITIRFNRAVDIDTVIAGQTIIVNAALEDNTAGTVSPGVGNASEITWLSTRPFAEIFAGNVGELTLRLVGTAAAAGVVQADPDGALLDGNGDGTAGGDFTIDLQVNAP